MPIRWDSLLARHLASELNTRLAGQQVRALRFDSAESDVFLLLRDCTLVWRLHPTRGHVLLRPFLDITHSDVRTGGRIRRIHTPPDERIVRFELLPKRSGSAHDIVIELLGNQWNLIVTDASSGIVRHVLHTKTAPRELRVGQVYRPPDPFVREGVTGEVEGTEWLEALGSIPAEIRARELVHRFAWTSPINASHFLGEDTDGPTETRLLRGHARWCGWATAEQTLRPVIFWFSRGPQPYPFPLANASHDEAQDLLQAFAAAHEAETEGTALAPTLLEPELAQRLERRTTLERKRVRTLERAIATIDDPARLRAEGDLILARYREIQRGAPTVTLMDFSGENLALSLDPALAPHENASQRYRDASRAERAATRLPELLTEARRQLRLLEALEKAAREGAVDVERVEAVLPADRSPGDARDPARPSLPYRAFRSSGGLEIRVGRGARHNDALTFRHSSPNDVWMHARHVAGAHVILRWNRSGNPPGRDLAEAATLAALHSKARTSASVPVDWTLRKYVRKPRGAPRGSVTMERAQTIFVDPDPELMLRLAVGRGD